MGVFFKKEEYADPTKKDAAKMFYPRLVTLGQSVGLDVLTYKIRNVSSLSKGDIQSVITNFVETMRESLYAGQSVNIKDFGVFSLSCEGEGFCHTQGVYGRKNQTGKHQFPSFHLSQGRPCDHPCRRENRIHRPASLSGSAERSRKRIG